MTDVNKVSSCDVLIIGGGLVGASLAIALAQPLGGARQPLRIKVIEAFPLLPQAKGKHYQPSFDARSTAISWGTRLIYEQLGLWSDVAARAEAISLIHVSDRGRFGATRMTAEDMRTEALGYVVENQWLGIHLLGHMARYPNISVECPAQVQQVVQTEKGALVEAVRLDSNSQDTLKFQSQVVVLADGGRSGLREQLGMGTLAQDYDQWALIANLATENPHEGQAFERFTDQGPIAMLPIPDGAEGEYRCALVWTLPADQAEAMLSCPKEVFLSCLQDRFGYRLGRLLRVGERFGYPLKLEVCQEPVRPGIVVMGNAAHTLHPVAGQGYNLALRGAMALAEVLRDAQQSAEVGSEVAPWLGALSVLSRFQRWHEVDQFKTTLMSDQLIRIFANNDPLLTVVRDLGLIGMDIVSPAKQLFAKQAMGLG